MESVLEVQGLSKYYGSLRALNNIDLKVPRGSVFGLLGPNGSGKTTFLGLITDVLKTNSGHFQWLHEQEPHHRKKIGTLLETPNFYPYLSAADNLSIDAATKECSPADIERVLKIVSLYEKKTMLFKHFSLGMKQRLAIASSLLGRPEVVILDEPTNGLDPVGIADIRKLIIQMGQAGTTVLIASHLLGEIQKVCTHVAILKQGQILASGTVDQVLSSDETLLVEAQQLPRLEQLLATCPGIQSIERTGAALRLTLQEDYSPAEVNAFCFHHQVILSRMQKEDRNLELKFLEITNQAKAKK